MSTFADDDDDAGKASGESVGCIISGELRIKSDGNRKDADGDCSSPEAKAKAEGAESRKRPVRRRLHLAAVKHEH